MTKNEKTFNKKSIIAFDKSHREIISYNMSKYQAAFNKGKSSLENLEKLKSTASAIKDDAVKNLKKYLQQFENKFTGNGGKIIWAKNEKEATNAVLNILQSSNSKMVVKSKSMITEEIELNRHLEENNIEVVETDLGEYIVQTANEKPYHIVTPAMHKSKEDIANLFNEKFGTPIDYKPKELTEYVRKQLREKFINADAGISGANFLLADIGGISITENEGNAVLTASNSKVHIVIAGIEKILPSVDNLATFLPLLSVHGTGQKITAYNSVYTGPAKNKDGSKKDIILILLDNERSTIYNNKEVQSSLKCIKCGACLNACPVYQNIGGYTYNTVYSGPIGAVITPHLKGQDKFGHLSFASSLCGKCNEVCPVKINLSELLLINRRLYVNNKHNTPNERKAIHFSTNLLLKRKKLNSWNNSFKTVGFKLFLGKRWGKQRKNLIFSKNSFNTIYSKKFGLKPYIKN